MLKCAVQVIRWWDTRAHRPAICTRNRCTHYVPSKWTTAPGWSLNYPRPKSITHLRTFSDNGVYVALQLFLVILVSDQWRRVLIPYSTLIDRNPGVFYMLRDDSPDIHGTNGFTCYPGHRRHTLQCWKPGFYTLQFLVVAGIEPPTSWLPGQRVTTRPWLSVTHHCNWAIHVMYIVHAS